MDMLNFEMWAKGKFNGWMHRERSLEKVTCNDIAYYKDDLVQGMWITFKAIYLE